MSQRQQQDEAAAPPAAPSVEVPVRRWWQGECEQGSDRVVSEHPVAMVYNGVSHVVMMATPTDLEDFALGFSLTEGIIDDVSELYSELYEVESLRLERGFELRMAIGGRCFARLRQRRRNLAGRTGCGLCGAESLEQAIRPLPRVADDLRLPESALQRAVALLDGDLATQRQTGAIHKAAWCDSAGNIVLLRDDVGRHNALDKLIGARLRLGVAAPGFALVSSRASYEMVAKAAVAGVQLLAAVSAPTSLAVELAGSAGLTLVGFARPGRHTVYTHPERLLAE